MQNCNDCDFLFDEGIHQGLPKNTIIVCTRSEINETELFALDNGIIPRPKWCELSESFIRLKLEDKKREEYEKKLF
jgi:hypothetical protein